MRTEPMHRSRCGKVPEVGDSWEFLEAERCWGEAEAWLRGDPGGRLSVTLWRAAMGDCPLVEELGPSGEVVRVPLGACACACGWL